MKKRILSMLLALCLICMLLPVSAMAAELEEITFAYAYDVYRSPSFPYGMGSTITAYSLDKPLDSDGNEFSSNEGSWTLTKAGTYAELKTAGKANSVLNSIISSLDGYYMDITSENRAEIVIHQLKRNGEHVSYGVVLAYDITAGNVVFIGDTHFDGAGYLLSNAPQSGTVNVVAGKVANEADGENTCAIALNQSGTVTFTSADAGYAEAPEAKNVTIINAGNVATGDLTIALSGDNADSFTLSKTSCNISVYGTETFAIQPKLGLTPGTHTATVTVSGENVEAKSFEVCFNVNTTRYTVTYKVGNEVVSTQTVEYGKDATAPAIPEKSGYTAAWDKDGKNITADTEINAVYTAIPATPVTGDSFAVGVWMTILAISVAAMAALVLLKKRAFA